MQRQILCHHLGDLVEIQSLADALRQSGVRATSVKITQGGRNRLAPQIVAGTRIVKADTPAPCADHFAILKVGPALTFAFREAVFALEAIEREWLSGRNGLDRSCVRDVLEKVMLENPVYWKNYYRGDEPTLRLARQYSYSDRSRYYWPHPEVAAAFERLVHNLTTHAVPISLLSQYLPRQSEAVREGKLRNEPMQLIRHRILETIDPYAFACGLCAAQRRQGAGA